MSDKPKLSEIESVSNLECRDQCREEGCGVQLDGIPDKTILRPDEADTEDERADCAIFFPEQNSSDTQKWRGRNSSNPSAHAVDYISIVELKNTLRGRKKVERQIKGAVEYCISLLREHSDPPWNISWVCVIAKNRVRVQQSKLQKISFKKHINGETYFFRPVVVDSGKSVRDIVNSEELKQI